MDLEQLNYDFNEITDESFKLIKEERVKETINITPEMFDYMIGDKNSLRFDWVLSLVDDDERISEMSKLVSEILPVGFPDEVYNWYSRECLGLQYTKYQLKDIKRKYKIQKKRENEKKKLELKKLTYTKKNVVLVF